ncbi:hypothetical protein NEMIN01_1261 [Nematocida minor]|uniref:uncharacterized protein n=1 Tax=Nematocida minor TaxID=1912983 RepID=UPI00221EB777|nr:uncharacterized protein NEMIN01_1261 [Nematocida minor]KAI5190859.1 hypothetical protein NEMIN01_1261 [Nematocida minor]
MNIKRTVKDIDTTIKEMDKQYDANFEEWVRSEENIDILSVNLKKYLSEYTESTYAEVLKWITEDWAIPSKVLLMKKILLGTLFRNNSPAEIKLSKRSIRIIKNTIEDWSSMYISELIIEFMGGMQKEEKRLFLLWILEDLEHQKITEIFIRIDSIVDWTLKISIIKNSKSLQKLKDNQ